MVTSLDKIRDRWDSEMQGRNTEKQKGIDKIKKSHNNRSQETNHPHTEQTRAAECAMREQWSTKNN